MKFLKDMQIKNLLAKIIKAKQNKYAINSAENEHAQQQLAESSAIAVLLTKLSFVPHKA